MIWADGTAVGDCDWLVRDATNRQTGSSGESAGIAVLAIPTSLCLAVYPGVPLLTAAVQLRGPWDIATTLLVCPGVTLLALSGWVRSRLYRALL